jgi:hypothetical protein
MATRNPNETQGSQRQGRQAGVSESGQGVGSPVSNEAFNVISALHKKLEGLEAFRKYARDGNERIWTELSQRDNEAVRVLVDELEKLVRDGRFRLGQPGQSAH